jgi:hypothetical protein
VFGGTEEQIKGPSFSPDTKDRDSPEINHSCQWFKLEQEFLLLSFFFLSIAFDSTERKITLMVFLIFTFVVAEL